MESTKHILYKWQDEIQNKDELFYTIEELSRQVELYSDMPSFQKGLIQTIKVLKQEYKDRYDF